MVRRVQLREFEHHPRRCVECARAGEIVVIEDGASAVAEFAAPSVSGRLSAGAVDSLIKSGRAHWSGRRFEPPPEPPEVPAGFSISDLIVEERQEAADRFTSGGSESLPR
jgi:hypothetical protein